MVASQPLLATLAELLEAHGLERLVETLHEKASLADLQSRLASNRPLMLAHLKAIGVDRLGDRQALANALSKSEKSGQIAAAVPIAQLRPPIFDEDDDALTVKLKLPPHVSSNQLKMRVNANSLRVELCGEATACCGKLHALVRPSDCTWELERSPRPSTIRSPPRPTSRPRRTRWSSVSVRRSREGGRRSSQTRRRNGTCRR